MVKMIQVSDKLHEKLFQLSGKAQMNEGKKISVEEVIWKLIKKEKM